MNSYANPDIDPANNGTLAGTLQFAFYKLMQSVNGMLPAQVVSVNAERTRVQVQLLIAVVTTEGVQVSRPQIASLPVFTIGGGGLFLSFPLNPGDLGWVLANDRDISLFLQTYNETAPNTGRVKDFADGVFIPDVMRNYTINSEDNASAVLSSIDGTVRIAIHPTGIKITSGAITIDADSTIDGTLHATGTITGDAGANLSGTIALTGLGTYPFVMTP